MANYGVGLPGLLPGTRAPHALLRTRIGDSWGEHAARGAAVFRVEEGIKTDLRFATAASRTRPRKTEAVLNLLCTPCNRPFVVLFDTIRQPSLAPLAITQRLLAVALSLIRMLSKPAFWTSPLNELNKFGAGWRTELTHACTLMDPNRKCSDLA